MLGSAPVAPPLTVVRELYAAWGRGDFAAAAAKLDPAVKWESFKQGKPDSDPDAMLSTTVGGAGSGATFVFEAVDVELLAGAGDHAIAFASRGKPRPGKENERLEVWTVREGRVVRFRGFPREEGLRTLAATTGLRRLETLCRGLASYNRRDVEGWVKLFHREARIILGPTEVWDGRDGVRRFVDDQERMRPGARIDDVQVVGETHFGLVVSAQITASEHFPEPLHLVVSYGGDKVAWIAAHPTAEQARAAAAAL